MTGVGVAFIAFFFYLVTRLTTPGMAMLYNELDPADGGRIVAKLDSMGVPYELRGNGSHIMVPSDQVLRLRMSMAQEGIPSGGSMGYELFDRSETLGTSNFVLNIQHLRALEGELARTIRAISYVHAARVHLVMPRRQLFSRDKQESSASIVLQMRGGRRLEKSEVQAIQHLVAAAVPQLKPSRISIIDDQGTLLARGREEGATGGGSSIDSDAMKASFEKRLSGMIETILERTVGPGKVRAEVSAEMDFDRISTTTESFDPESQVARSTQSVEETATATDSEPASSQSVSIASNLPGAPAPAASGSTAKNATNSNRTEETVNFEISKTTTTHLRESGIVKRLSVAVLIDGFYADDGNGNRVYKERPAAEITKLKKLVSSAIGFNAKRGDTLELINMRFANNNEEDFDEPARALFGFGKNDYIRIAELGILAVVSILVILLVVRPMIKRILDALPEAIASSKKVLNESVAAAANPALPNQAGTAVVGDLAAATQIPGPNVSAPAPLVNMDQVDGRVAQSSLKQIGEIVDKHPEEAVNIIRNWMYQET